MRMKLLCAFAKSHGYDYLRMIIKPVLDQMVTLASSHSFQLDPARTSEEEVKDNQEVIKVFAQAFLQIVCGSASAMPL